MNARGWSIPNGGVAPDNQLGSSLTSESVRYGHLLLLGLAGRQLVHDAERDAWRGDRATVHHRPLRGVDRRQRDGPASDRRRFGEAIEQYFAPAKRSRSTH